MSDSRLAEIEDLIRAHTFICETCGQQIYAEKGQRFCSKSCSNRRHIGPAPVRSPTVDPLTLVHQCGFCGKLFFRNRPDQPNPLFCSRECSAWSRALWQGVACKEAGCGESVISRGWCSNHYARWRRVGDPLRCESCIDCGQEKSNHRTLRCGDCQAEQQRMIVAAHREKVEKLRSGQKKRKKPTLKPVVPTSRSRERWTPAEDAVIRDNADEPLIKLCFMLERGWYAVAKRRAILRSNAARPIGAKIDSHSGVRNAYPKRGGWEVQVARNGKKYWGGHYRDLDSAAVAAAALRERVYGYRI